MKRRLLIIVLALILAAVGTGGVVAYVKNANARAIAGMKAVSVLVAQKTIPSGTTAQTALRTGLLADEKLPASAVPANALGSLTPDLFSLKFTAAVRPGQLLLRPMLGTIATSTLTSGMAIPPGEMAVTVSFCLSEVVAGAVHAGSEVAVFDTVGSGLVSGQPGCTGPHAQVTGTNKTRMVLPRMMVLSVGASSATGTAGSTSTTSTSALSPSTPAGQAAVTMVTLAANQAQAEQLIQLTETGVPYLALLSPSSRTSADIGSLLTARPKSAPVPVLTFPVVTPSPAPSIPAPSASSPAPKPSPAPTKKRRK
jgi:pilus assembly protein CpaB